MGGVYYLLQDSVGFDNLMHGKSPKGNQKQRSLEDFGKITPILSDPDIQTNNISQLSRSSVCRLNTRSRNKCGVFGVVGKGRYFLQAVLDGLSTFSLTFPCPIFCNMASGGDVDSHTL